jgi:hypothetical protein
MVTVLLVSGLLLSGCLETGIRNGKHWYATGYGGEIGIADLGEFIGQPVMFIIVVCMFRWLWDHGAVPLSGLLSKLCRLLAILPGYVHEDMFVYG